MQTKHFPIAGGLSIPLLVSSILPPEFHHGFSTRSGGVSAPPFDTLNLGAKWGDSAESVEENRRRLRLAARVRAIHAASQVHGTRILRVNEDDDPQAVRAEQADGLCSAAADIAASVHVADCVPVLMADPVTGAFAAVHAGWRGTVAGAVTSGLAALAAEFGSRPRDVRVALGPCIGPCCFCVGTDVAAAFESSLPKARSAGAVIVPSTGQPRVDLRLYQRLQLQTAGVLPEHIDAASACTHCDPEARFFSYRRSGRQTGQMVAFIARQ